MKLLAAVIAAIVALVGCGSSSKSVKGDLLVTADRLFDGQRIVTEGAVLIRGRSIAAAGPRDSLDVTAKRTLDLRNATLLPGFVDLHVHQLGEGMLLGGVTTVRDLGAPETALPTPRATPGRIRVLAAGLILTVPRGYPGTAFSPSLGAEIRGAAQARRTVARLTRKGAALIKVALEPGPRNWPMLSRAELGAIVDEAHRRHRIVSAHVSEARGTRLAVDAGVDELAHAPCEASPSLMREAAERGITIIGTLHVRSRCAGALRSARLFVRAGGVLLYGTDYGNPGIPPQIDVRELRLMVDSGLTTQQAISAAPSRAGQYIGLAPLGSLTEGRPADIIAVSGNPFRDLRALERLEFLAAGGEVVLERGRVSLPAG